MNAELSSSASSPGQLSELKIKVARAIENTSLFDTPQFARNLEAAYQNMYDRYQSDLPPAHFSIPPDGTRIS
jgi:hypothetical protein